MPLYIPASLAALFGISLALPLQWIYNQLPEAWLQDYDCDFGATNFRVAKRMSFFPATLVLLVLLPLLFALAVLFNPSIYSNQEGFRFFLLALALPILVLIIVSDQLNRIIPDPLVLALVLCSSLGFLADWLQGNVWFWTAAPWYYWVGNRILGAIIGAGLLWGISLVGSYLSGGEAMGFGDIKLIFATGLVVGIFGLGFVLLTAFVLGGIVALPLLIRKRLRLKQEKTLILKSSNPDKTRQELEAQKVACHFAENPDYIAFGPFIALGTILFLVFETPIFKFFQSNFLGSGGVLS